MADSWQIDGVCWTANRIVALDHYTLRPIKGGIRVECGPLAIEPGFLECGELRAPCPECTPFGWPGHVLLFNLWSLCNTCVARCPCGKRIHPTEHPVLCDEMTARP